MSGRKLLLIDRDGTLIVEPEDQQVDSLDKLELLPGVIPALLSLQQAGYVLVMVSNQDGLGTRSFPEVDFTRVQDKMLALFESQGIRFESVRICPHFEKDGCDCRKPRTGLVLDLFSAGGVDLSRSAVIGDRETDLELANRLGIKGIRVGEGALVWSQVQRNLMTAARTSRVERNTRETRISVEVDLERSSRPAIETGIGFFDHMLEQIAAHGGFYISLQCEGDTEVDDHHTVEDCALALGEALDQALGDRRGIHRFGFVLPMDESRAKCLLDLSGRSLCRFEGQFDRESVGGLATEMVPHFFRSLSDGLRATLHMQVEGENTHHKVEACFKSLGRTLRQAIARQGNELPSSKGVL